jgi:hypothetical protein
VLDAVLPRLNVGARVPVCGLIAYNDTGLPPSPDRMPQLLGLVLRKRLLLQGFIISDHYADGFTAFQCDMGGWVAAGKVQAPRGLRRGLERAPQARSTCWPVGTSARSWCAWPAPESFHLHHSKENFHMANILVVLTSATSSATPAGRPVSGWRNWPHPTTPSTMPARP